MKIPSFETKYNPGDIVIVTWEDEYPELAMIESITNIWAHKEGNPPTIEYRLKSPTYSRIHRNSNYEGDRCEDGIMCKFEDICNDKRILKVLKKAFDEEGIVEDDWQKICKEENG